LRFEVDKNTGNDVIAAKGAICDGHFEVSDQLSIPSTNYSKNSYLQEKKCHTLILFLSTLV